MRNRGLTPDSASISQGKFEHGDVYTWVALDSDSKLVISGLVGKRTASQPRQMPRRAQGRGYGQS